MQDGLRNLRHEIELREQNVRHLERRLADVKGVNIQSRGRRADIQSYYCLTLLIKPEVLNDVSLDQFIAALNAEGLTSHKSYGPVYEHALWNLPTSAYKLADGGCPECERIASTSAITIAHQWLLGDDRLTELMADAITKVAVNCNNLV